ncbi:MAG: type IV secretion system DNA-binding domain-containing protein, partial [Nitrospiraceae bacterium]|nr:type IV secretion system DNA-binding domain-containing protein [Nitrospiraceae bacterium]
MKGKSCFETEVEAAGTCPATSGYPDWRGMTIIGMTNWRNERKPFAIKEKDRRHHIYVIGKTGMGKTTLLENMIVQDIHQGRGVGVLDPHGDLAKRLLDFVPRGRINDVVYFNPGDLDWPFALNPFEHVAAERRSLVAASLMAVFEKLFSSSWGPRMAHILRNCILTLLEVPGATLLGVPRLLYDIRYRDKALAKVTDPKVNDFWINEFSTYQSGFRAEAIAPALNKVGAFLTSPLVRNIVGQARAKVNFRVLIDHGKILIANLAKGAVGEENQALLGSLILTKLQLAAMERVDVEEEQRRDFHLYCDEFQNFASPSFIEILSEARKYRLDLTLAHQYMEQLDSQVRGAILGNVGTLIAFRVGASDAEELEKEFAPELSWRDFIHLSPYSFYIRLCIDGVTSRPFNADALPPRNRPRTSYRETIIRVSR